MIEFSSFSNFTVPPGGFSKSRVRPLLNRIDPRGNAVHCIFSAVVFRSSVGSRFQKHPSSHTSVILSRRAKSFWSPSHRSHLSVCLQRSSKNFHGSEQQRETLQQHPLTVSIACWLPVAVTMNLVDLSRSLLIVPAKYDDVRPHHFALGYAALRLLSASGLLEKCSKSILSFFSLISESCVPLVHAGLIPDFVIRFGIRLQLYNHLNILKAEHVEQELDQKLEIIHKLKTMPIAIETDAANEQHYEVPAKFYDLCLGPRKKYSSGYWPEKNTTFEESEVAMLEKYCKHAGVKDGMKIVDLGCGWGSLTLHLAERYPNAKITGISNSHSQREYILATAKKRGYNVDNITIVSIDKKSQKGTKSFIP